MQTKVINPYAFIGTKHKETLDFIGTNLPPDPTFEQLNEVLVAGSFTADPDHLTLSGFAQTFAGTILPNVYNCYVNSGTNQNTLFAEKQQLVINHLLQGIKGVPPQDIGVFLENAEGSIVSSGLTFEEQIPLFIAFTCAKADFEYWDNQITTPGIWVNYMDANPAISYMYLPGVVEAAAKGALFTYGLMKKPEIQLLDMYVSLMGATGLAAGKVVLGWVGK